MVLIDNKSSLVLLGDDDYSRRFLSEKMKFVNSSLWQTIIGVFLREMKQQVASGDLEALKSFLRNKRRSVLDDYKTKGCYYIWDRCFVKEKNLFDGGVFLKTLELMPGDKELMINELNDTFTYICLTENIDGLLTKVLALENAQKSSGNNVHVQSSQIIINQGSIVINKDNNSEQSQSFSEDEEVLTNLIFLDKYFYNNHLLHRLRNEIGKSIDLKNYNNVFKAPERKKINPEIQSEWYYIIKAILESGITKKHSINDFLDQMYRWYPSSFEKFESLEKKKELFNRMGKSCSTPIV